MSRLVQVVAIENPKPLPGGRVEGKIVETPGSLNAAYARLVELQVDRPGRKVRDLLVIEIEWRGKSVARGRRVETTTPGR